MKVNPYIIGILLLGVFLFASITATEKARKEKALYQQKNEQLLKQENILQEQLRRTERRLVDANRRIDSIVSVNSRITTSLDSLDNKLREYKNPYRNKTNEELANLMNGRAK